MKGILTRIINAYNTNTLFHNAVNGLEMAIGTYFEEIVRTGKWPTTKGDWASVGTGLLYALWSWWKRWSQQNLATVGVAVKP